MHNKKLHYKILSGILLICLLICLDIRYGPSKYSIESIESVTRYAPTYRSGGASYRMTTERTTYRLSGDFYFAAAKGGKVTVIRSEYSNSHRSMQIVKDGVLYTMETGFMRDSGFYFLFYLAVATLLFAAFYERVAYIPARLHLSIFLAVLATGLLLLHIYA